MKKILAVSGGIDSMVMLDVFVRKNTDDLIVAHFNHGTRGSTTDDERFIRQKSEEYGVKFISGKAVLGEEVSEEAARQARYNFLYHVANKFNGEIYTAHHLDDLLESIAINLIRGTGWRGLTPLENTKIKRPLLEKGFSRNKILQYASENNLIFRQDPTNNSDSYLRNRVRETLRFLTKDQRLELMQLNHKQRKIRREVEDIVKKIALSVSERDEYGLNILRSFFYEIDEAIGVEILREILDKVKIHLTRPRLLDLLQAIKTYQNGKKFNLPKDRMAEISKEYIRIKIELG